MNEPVTDSSTTADNNNDGDNNIGLVVSEALEGTGVRPDIWVACVRKIAQEILEKTYKNKYEAMESDFEQMKLDNERLKHRIDHLTDVERAVAGDGFAMDNIMFRHMCNVGLSSVYYGMCAAFLQTDVESLPQAIFCKDRIVDWWGEVQDLEGFWEKVPYLFDLKLQNNPKPAGDGMNWSVYELLTDADRSYYGVRGEYKKGKTGKLFYLSFNDEVVESDHLSKGLPVAENLLRFLRNMRARIHRRVKQLRRDSKEAHDRRDRLQEDVRDIRHEVNKLANLANQHRKDKPIFDVGDWLRDYSRRPLIAPRADTPVPQGRGKTYAKNKLLAQRRIVGDLVPKMTSLSEAEKTVDDLEDKLPRMENYLYFTTIALRLLREKDIAGVLVNPESEIRGRLKALGNASAHPLDYRPRIRAAVDRLHDRDDFTEAERSLVMKMATILGTDPPDSIREFEFWCGNYSRNPKLPENARGVFLPHRPDLHYYYQYGRDRGLQESNLVIQRLAGVDGSESPTWQQPSLPVRREVEVEPVTIAPESSHGPPPPSSPRRLPNQSTPPVSVAIGLPPRPLLEPLAFGGVYYDSSSGAFSVSSEDEEEAGEERDVMID